MAHTVCVGRDGAVYACGWNSHGQLGTARRAGDSVGGTTPSPEGTVGSLTAAGAGDQQQQQALQQQLVCVSSLQPELLEDPQLEQEHVVQVGLVTEACPSGLGGGVRGAKAFSSVWAAAVSQPEVPVASR